MKIYLECAVHLHQPDKPVVITKYRRKWPRDVPFSAGCRIWPFANADDPGGKYAMMISVINVHAVEDYTVVKLYSVNVMRCNSEIAAVALDTRLKLFGWNTVPDQQKEGQA